MDPELTNIVGILIAAAAVVVVLAIVVAMAARRRLENGWQATQQQRSQLYDRLKNHGLMVRRFIETAKNRLANEDDALEVLGRRQTEVAAGRSPPEKAAAIVELSADLERLIAVADADPGLSGLSEYEKLREKIEHSVDDIGRAANNYNQAVDSYNRMASGFFGRLYGSLQVDRFDASKRRRGRHL